MTTSINTLLNIKVSLGLAFGVVVVVLTLWVLLELKPKQHLSLNQPQIHHSSITSVNNTNVLASDYHYHISENTENLQNNTVISFNYRTDSQSTEKADLKATSFDSRDINLNPNHKHNQTIILETLSNTPSVIQDSPQPAIPNSDNSSVYSTGLSAELQDSHLIEKRRQVYTRMDILFTKLLNGEIDTNEIAKETFHITAKISELSNAGYIPTEDTNTTMAELKNLMHLLSPINHRTTTNSSNGKKTNL